MSLDNMLSPSSMELTRKGDENWSEETMWEELGDAQIEPVSSPLSNLSGGAAAADEVQDMFFELNPPNAPLMELSTDAFTDDASASASATESSDKPAAAAAAAPATPVKLESLPLPVLSSTAELVESKACLLGVGEDGNAELQRLYKKKLREAAIIRLRRKRDERRMNGTGWRYAGRKRIADSRIRIKGRFVKNA